MMMIMIILGDGIVRFPLWNFHIGLWMMCSVVDDHGEDSQQEKEEQAQ